MAAKSGKDMGFWIGNVHIGGPLVLGPMAGVTDLPFRLLCREQGADLIYTEMVSAKGILYKNKNTAALLRTQEAERPVALQFFGENPGIMAEMAKYVEELPFDILDINMGCPAPKITNSGAGSALLKRPQLCGEIVRAVKEAVDVPVMVKIRAGWDNDSINAVPVALICQQAGADAITVHGRTRQDQYHAPANWDLIREVKQAVEIPVIGNGDIFCAQDAMRMLEQTNCDLVMVGRGALGNPWIFAQINAYLTESCCILPPPGLSERLAVMLRHMQGLCDHKGEYRAMREARKHVAWYLKGMRNAAKFRQRAASLEHFSELLELARDLLLENPGRETPVIPFAEQYPSSSPLTP